MSELPIVTVIMPLHNHEHWVTESVMSVVNQDYERKRMIIVDDASTDNSLKVVCKMMVVKHKKESPDGLIQFYGTIFGVEAIIVSLPKCHGPSFARNAGMTIGNEGTDYFAFLDSDDEYKPTKISKSVEKFMSSPAEVGVVYSDFTTFNQDGLRIRQYKEPYSRIRLVQECIINCDSLVSNYAIKHVGGFDNELRVCEDYDLWLRITEQFVAIHIPEDLVSIRVGEHSSSATVDKSKWNADYQKVMDKARDRATKNA